MHKEILTNKQIELLPVLKYFSKEYLLVGGTAIALYLGHRESIDFDLFSLERIKRINVKNYLSGKSYKDYKLLKEEEDQLHFIINGVKLTFFQFPFILEKQNTFDGVIGMPDLITLAAMKALALGGRGKWKDYVDLYFLLKYHFNLNDIITQAEKIFGASFNDKLFREQLAYFEDIDYSEDVIYRTRQVEKEEIIDFLIEKALEKF
ncbi:MAG: nucleotidyl transferase AbiEii/AbiGii toxin family protein [Melioribacteraceae bacterium]